MSSKLAYGPVHANNNVICAIDIRVGGEDADSSDLLEVCFMPVNHSYKVHDKFLMFNAKIRPVWPVDNRIAKVNQERLKDFETTLFDSVTARSMFEKWCENTLQLKRGKKVMPLVWDWERMTPFLKNWLGSSYPDYIEEKVVRDVRSVMHFINDRHAFWGEEIFFKKVQFTNFINRSDLEFIEKNSLTSNCRALLDGYRELLRRYIPGYAPKIVNE